MSKSRITPTGFSNKPRTTLYDPANFEDDLSDDGGVGSRRSRDDDWDMQSDGQV